MSTELSNGVIIPEEYSDDWYDEMSINLRKLNDVITAASDNATDIQRLDTDKANQSDLTALTSRVNQNETDIIALQTAVSGALKREIVQTLPTEDISTTTIYMIRNSESSGTNIYDEYMYINSQWELIGTSATDFGNYYTKNETDNLLSGKVDNSTLGSYYTKTESDNLLSAKANQTDLTSLSGRVTQNETDITALQTAVSGALKREIVQSLPTQDISTTTIYMIRNTTTSGDNIYDEYMYINNLWELIGTSATDFSNYYTKTEIDTQLSDKANNSDVVHKSGNETIGGAKTFTDTNTIKTSSPKVLLINTSQTGNTAPSSNTASFFRFDGGTVNNFGGVQFEFLTTGENRITNYAKDITTAKLNSIQQRVNSTTAMTVFNADLIVPATDGITALGNSSKRWSNIYGMNYYYGSNNVEFSTKFVTTDTAQTISGNKTFSSINGVEPSSLSLPSDRSARIDISSYFTDTSNGVVNRYTVPANGYIWLHFTSINSAVCYSKTSGALTKYAQTFVRSQGDGLLYAFFPVRKDDKFVVQIYTSSTAVVQNAYFIPCQGNV